jgi:peptidoglycan/LPS O-acetylase OafA/YrhL
VIDESFRTRRYFPALDGLRSVSIAAVIWHHSTPRPLAGLAGRGHLGVRLFFCISGLLITTLLLREKRERGQVALLHFWTRRALRIFPLYYTVLTLFIGFAITLPPASATRNHFIANLPYYLSHTSNWFVDCNVKHKVLFAFAWSLSTEEQFYLFLPVLVCLVPRRMMLSLLLLAIIVIDQLAEHRMLTFILPPHGRGEIIVTSFVASIGFGALLAVLLDDPRTFKWLRPALGHTISAPLLLGLVVLWLIAPPREFVWFEAALATFVAACAVGQDRFLPRVLSTSAFGHVGRVSYGMYLFHVAIIGAIRGAFPGIANKAVLVFPIALAISIYLATLSHRYFEAWFLSKRPGSRNPSARLGPVATTLPHRENVRLADN